MLHTDDLSSANRATPLLQPMRLTDILDGMFSLYRNHFRLFFCIALVYFGVALCLNLLSKFVFSDLIPPLDVLSSASETLRGSWNHLYTAPLLGFVFSRFTGFVYEVVFLLVAAGAIGFAGAHCYLGRTITPSGAFRQISRRFRHFFGYIIVAHLLNVLDLMLIGIEILFVVIYGYSYWIMSFDLPLIFWVTCIGIPFAIYLGVRWWFGALPILFEETSLRTALRRSSKLVKGTWWRVFGIYLAIHLLWWTLYTILQNTANVVLSLMGVTTGDNLIQSIMKIQQLVAGSNPFDANLPQQSFFSYLIEMSIGLGIAAFLLPIKPIGYMLLYFDLRIRKEGYDIEVMVNNRESSD